MHLVRRLQFLQKNTILLKRTNSAAAIAEGNSKEKIVIPKRIHRSPTDILKALSATVKRDPTAAHYKYHDDPYLIPTSNITKRTYAMANEAGVKAAQWIKEEHRDLFMVINLLN